MTGNPENYKAVTLATLQLISCIMEMHQSQRLRTEGHISLLYARLDLLSTRLDNQQGGDWMGDDCPKYEEISTRCRKLFAQMESQSERDELVIEMAREVLSQAVDLLGQA